MTNNSILILKNDINIEEGIDLDGYLIVDKDQKDLVVCKNQKRIVYSLLKKGQGQIYEKLRGYTILKPSENWVHNSINFSFDYLIIKYLYYYTLIYISNLRTYHTIGLLHKENRK